MLVLGSKVYVEAGPEVAADCLWCGHQSVRAKVRRETGWLTLFHFVPIFRLRNIFVRCSACGKDMIAKCSLADLVCSNPITLRHYLIKRQSFVGRVCILLGVLLCLAPMIGVLPAVIGFFYRKQFGCPMMALSWIALIISLISTALGLAALLLSRAGLPP